MVAVQYGLAIFWLVVLWYIIKLVAFLGHLIHHGHEKREATTIIVTNRENGHQPTQPQPQSQPQNNKWEKRDESFWDDF